MIPFLIFSCLIIFKCFYKRFHSFIFRERGREREREGEKHQCVVASSTPPTGDPVHNSGMCPNRGLNLWPSGSQAGALSTEPHQPGLVIVYSTATTWPFRFVVFLPKQNGRTFFLFLLDPVPSTVPRGTDPYSTDSAVLPGESERSDHSGSVWSTGTRSHRFSQTVQPFPGGSDYLSSFPLV